MAWQILDSGALPAEENMALDAKLLEQLDPHGACFLRFYEWDRPSATFGYFLKPEQFFRPEPLAAGRFAVARRPTGGGVIFHTCDLTFSVLIPAGHAGYSVNTMDNYAFINKRIANAIALLLKETNLELLANDPVALNSTAANFCMAKPTRFDVMMGQKKIAGGAERRTKKGFLHQATLSLIAPSEESVGQYLLHPEEVMPGILQQSASIVRSHEELKEIRPLIKKKLIDSFEELI